MHSFVRRLFATAVTSTALFAANLYELRGAATETLPCITEATPRFTFRFNPGDDPRWAAKDFDDSQWRSVGRLQLPSREGPYWVRYRLYLPSDRSPASLDGLILKVVASYELYWDGQLIGRNGRPADTLEGEIPGNVDALFQIPRELLAPGEHVVALRMSSFRTGFRSTTYGIFFRWANFRDLLVERSRTAMLSVMAVGAALVVGVVFGLMWLLAGRRPPLLLFSLLFLCAAAMQAMQAWRWLFDYPYHWHYPRLVAIAAIVSAVAALLPIFVMHHFRVGRPRWICAVVFVAILAAWIGNHYYNLIVLHAFAVGFGTAFALAALAAFRRKRGAAVACAGLAASLLALLLAPVEFLEHAFFLSAGPAAFGLLLALVLQLRDERKEAQQAKLTAARLEIELLKKNIEPHFVLNTLAALVEIIEQQPKTAVTLIEALADEFRLLNRISSEKLIPLSQELELCQAHLHVMSLRKGARCSLVTEGISPRAQLPPALFLTLIENGLTHLLPRDGAIRFHLAAKSHGSSTTYTLRADGLRQSDTPPASPNEGTGLRYIKARLEESFTAAWSLAGHPSPSGWETIITVPFVAAPPDAPLSIPDPSASLLPRAPKTA